MAFGRYGLVGATVVALAALGGSGMVIPTKGVPDEPVAVDVATSVLCPSKEESATKVTAAALGEAGEWRGVTKPTAQGLPRDAATVVDTTEASVFQVSAGGMLGAVAETSADAGLEKGLALVPCGQPATTSWFVGLRSTKVISTELILVNAENADANIDLTFYGPGGRVPVAASSSISVPPKSQKVVGLQPLIKLNDPLAVQVSVSTGRVASFARERIYQAGAKASDGVDWIGASQEPNTSVVVPGFLGGQGVRHLSIVNPNEDRAEVEVSIMSDNGLRPLAEGKGLAVAGLSTTVIQLDNDLPPEGTALLVRSASKILAGGRVSATLDTDAAHAVSTPAVTKSALVPLNLAERQTSLSFANPGSVPTKFDVTVKDVAGQVLFTKQTTLPPLSHVMLPLPASTALATLKVDVHSGTINGSVDVKQTLGGLESYAIVGIYGGFEPTRLVNPDRWPGMHS